MSAIWDGADRRRPVDHYEMAEMLRHEINARDAKIMEKLDAVIAKQLEMEKKIDRWETSLFVIQWIAGITVGVIAMVATALTWVKDHVRL